ncbi:MAG: YggT family protein [Chloroflexota bacterium]
MGGQFLVNFVRFLLLALQLLILARVLLSWLDPMGRSRFAPFLIAMTEPILAPVRRLLPRTGAFDLSPLIVLLVLGIILRYVP